MVDSGPNWFKPGGSDVGRCVVAQARLGLIPPGTERSGHILCPRIAERTREAISPTPDNGVVSMGTE